MIDDVSIVKHYINYFGQEPLFSMKFKIKEMEAIKVHVFYPTKKYNFYKLATSGCSYILGDYNEYMMFLSKECNVDRPSVSTTFMFFPMFLIKASLIGLDMGEKMSFFDIANLKHENAAGVMYLPSQIIPDPGILSYHSREKDIDFLQVMPLTQTQFNFATNCKNLSSFAELFYTHDKKGELISMHPFADKFELRDNYSVFKKY